MLDFSATWCGPCKYVNATSPPCPIAQLADAKRPLPVSPGRALFPKLEELAQDSRYTDIVRRRSSSSPSNPALSFSSHLKPSAHSAGYQTFIKIDVDELEVRRATINPAGLALLALLLGLLLRPLLLYPPLRCGNDPCAPCLPLPQELAEDLDVSALPTIGLFRKGVEIDRSVGNDIDGVIAMLDKAGAVSRGASSTNQETVDGGKPSRGLRASLVRTMAPHNRSAPLPRVSSHSDVLTHAYMYVNCVRSDLVSRAADEPTRPRNTRARLLSQGAGCRAAEASWC